MNKLELFKQIVDAVTVQYNKDTANGWPRKITIKETDEYICYFFSDIGYSYGKTMENIKQMKEVLKTTGWAGQEVYEKMRLISNQGGGFVRSALRCFYNKVKDKISIGTREWGYEWGDRKQRVYPIARTIHAFCYSKHMYRFVRMGRKGKLVPRIAKGTTIDTYYGGILFKAILGIDYTPSINALFREYIGTCNDYEVIEKSMGVKIPKIFKEKRFAPEEVRILYKALANKNEITSVCQFISTLDNQIKNPLKSHDAFGFDDSNNHLFRIVGTMVLGSADKGWLVGDWIRDHVVLGRTMSLKVRSETRIADEHRKMSKERMIKGIREITVSKKYHDLFKDSDLNFELITNKKRLLQESIERDHCVATYASQINSGSCAIFSFKWEEQFYTLQVNQEFFNVQFRGLRNCDAPPALCAKVEEYLSNYRIKHPPKEQVPVELPF